MLKSLHMRFMENCLSDNVSPNGLQVKLKVQVGNIDVINVFVFLMKSSIDKTLDNV